MTSTLIWVKLRKENNFKIFPTIKNMEKIISNLRTLIPNSTTLILQDVGRFDRGFEIF